MIADIHPLMMFSGYMVVGVLWWAFGQWLRSRGFGPKLDRIAANTGAFKRRVCQNLLQWVKPPQK